MTKILAIICLLLFSISCTEKTIKPYDKTVPVELEINILKHHYFGLHDQYITDHYSGKLTLINYELDTTYYEVSNTLNSLYLPFGFYNAYISDFQGFSNDSLEVIALGGNEILRLISRISPLPDFSVEINSDSIANEHYLKLYLKAPFNNNQLRVEIYGSDDTLRSTMQFLDLYYIEFWEDSIGQRSIADINEEKTYKYYNVSVAPYTGYDTIIKLSKWYPIKSISR